MVWIDWFALQVIRNCVRIKFDRAVAGIPIANQTSSVQVQMLAVYPFFLSLSLKQVWLCSIDSAFHIRSIFHLYRCVCLDWQGDWTLYPPCSFMQIPDFFQEQFSLVEEEYSCPVDVFSVTCSSTDLAGWLNHLQFPPLLLWKFDQSSFPLSSRALLRYCSCLEALCTAFAWLMGLYKKQTVSVPAYIRASRWTAGVPS